MKKFNRKNATKVKNLVSVSAGKETTVLFISDAITSNREETF